MKHVGIILIYLLLTIVPQSVLSQEKDTLFLKLDDALEIALSENRTIKIAEKEINKSEYAKKGTYAALFPEINGTGSYQRTLKKQTMYMDPGTGVSTKISMGRNNTWSGGFNASMPVVSAELWKGLEISAMDVELTIEKARSSKIDMIEQVTNTYYSILMAVDSYNVFKSVYDNALQNYYNVKQKFDVGKTSEYEVIRADVSVKNAEPNLYQAENDISLAKWQLKALLGIDLNINIECRGNLYDYKSTLINPMNSDIYIGSNSSLKQIEIQGRQLDKTLEMKKASNYPTLSLAISYNIFAMNDSYKFRNYDWTPYSTAGLTLSIPIFAGGKRRSELNQTKVSISQLKLQKEETERNLYVMIKQYTNSMESCIKQYIAAQSSVTEAEKGYLIAVKRYEIGDGTQLEINDSQLVLTQARLNMNQSIYNYLTAKSAIDKITGKYE